MNIFKYIRKIYFFIGFSWLLFMLMFPSDLQIIKYVTLILLIALSFVYIVYKKNLEKNLIIGVTIWLVYFTFSLAIGIYNRYSIDFFLINTYFFTPIVSLIISATIDNEKKFVFVNKILIIITFLILTVDLIYIFDALAIISLPFDFQSNIFGSIEINDKYLGFRITNQSSLIFLLPYIIALTISHGYSTKPEKYFYIIIIFLGIAVAMLSGRRALQAALLLSLASSIFIHFKFFKFRIRISKIPINIILLTFSLIIGAVFINWISKFLELDNIVMTVYETFISAFDVNTTGGLIRNEQARQLIDGWQNSPVFGNGLNSYLSNYIRSSFTPWSYEMVYHALIYQSGIIGFSLFFSVVYLFLRKLYKNYILFQSISGKYFFGIFIGFLVFIISGGSNPMVYYVWAWCFAMFGYTVKKDNRLLKE